MIIITKIEYIQIERDVHELICCSYDPDAEPLYPANSDEPVSPKEVQEIVRGRKFRHPDGREIRVGMSEQAGNLLGLQYEAWQDLEERLIVSLRTSLRLSREIQAAKHAGFLTRLKWLIKGYRYYPESRMESEHSPDK